MGYLSSCGAFFGQPANFRPRSRPGLRFSRDSTFFQLIAGAWKLKLREAPLLAMQGGDRLYVGTSFRTCLLGMWHVGSRSVTVFGMGLPRLTVTDGYLPVRSICDFCAHCFTGERVFGGRGNFDPLTRWLVPGRPVLTDTTRSTRQDEWFWHPAKVP